MRCGNVNGLMAEKHAFTGGCGLTPLQTGNTAPGAGPRDREVANGMVSMY